MLVIQVIKQDYEQSNLSSAIKKIKNAEQESKRK